MKRSDKIQAGWQRGLANATNAVTAIPSSGRVPSSSREKESQHEDESIYGHGRRCSGSLGRWCYVDRTIGLGWHRLLQWASHPPASS